MSPPTHVKVASAISSIALGTLGVRRLVAPSGSGFKIQSFFDGGKASGERSRGEVACSSLLGHILIILAVTKLATIFSFQEGTFLRRNLFIAFGASQLFMALSMFTRFESDAKQAGSSLKFLTLIVGGEGLVLLWDALKRPRPLKKK